MNQHRLPKDLRLIIPTSSSHQVALSYLYPHAVAEASIQLTITMTSTQPYIAIIGGGVSGRGGRDGDEARDEDSPAFSNSRLGFRPGGVVFASRSGRRCMNVDSKFEKRLLALN